MFEKNTKTQNKVLKKIIAVSLILMVVSSGIGVTNTISPVENAKAEANWTQNWTASEQGGINDIDVHEGSDTIVEFHEGSPGVLRNYSGGAINKSSFAGTDAKGGYAIDYGFGAVYDGYNHVIDAWDGKSWTTDTGYAWGVDMRQSNGYSYVLDNSAIVVLDRSGMEVNRHGVNGVTGQHEIVVAESQNLVIGALYQQIEVRDLSLNPQWNSSHSNLNQIAIQGDYIYATDTNGNLIKLDTSGNLIYNKSAVSATPTDLTTDGDGNVYISHGSTVSIFSGADGSYTDKFTGVADNIASLNTYVTNGNINILIGAEAPSSTDSATIYSYDTGNSLKSTVTATVTDNSGTALENADVTIEDSAGSVVFTGTTDVNGEVSTELVDGDYTLIADKKDYYQNTMAFSVSGSNVNIQISLDSKPEISGTVVESDTESKTIANATVKILQNGTKVTKVLSKSDGTFSVTVDKGTYTINVSKDTYESNETTVNVTNSVDIGEIALKPKEYNLNLRVSPYMNHSDTQEYVVRFNDDTITGNVTVKSSNITLITVNQTSHKLIATDVKNDTGEVNITATYTVDNHTIRDSENVTVSPMTIEYVEILSPLYSSIAISTDKTIQFLILAVVAGVGVATIINAFGGIGMMIIALIMGWIMDYTPLGVLLACLFGGIFIMMNTQLNEYRTR